MTLAQTMQKTTEAFQEFNRVYTRCIEIDKWQARSVRFSIPRWRRLIARYVVWCLRCEVRREIAAQRRSS